MKNILFICSFAFFLAAKAQSVDVYFAKGEVTVKSGSAITKVTTSTKLMAGDVLQLKPGATVILLQGEKALVVKDKNELTFTEIQKRIANSKRSVSDRYLTYLWQKTHEVSSQKDDEGSGKMNVTGMVTRGEAAIRLPADSSIILRDALIISVEKDVIPGFLVIYKKKKPLFSIAINQEEIALENMELIAKNEWVGLGAKKDKAAPMGQIVYVKWANDAEKLTAEKELQQLLMELSSYPEEVQEEMITAFYRMNNYVN